MRYLAIVALILFTGSMAVGQDSNQISKEEKKKLKKQAKALKSDLRLLKAMNTELESLRARDSQIQANLQSANKQVTDLNSRIEELEGQLAEAKTASAQAAPRPARPATPGAPIDETGLSFRIQIGGYKNLDLAQYSDPQGELVKVEANDKGTEEITLGRFTSYQKADQFKKHLRAMGLKDAWIVPYKDGQRVPLKDVVDQLDIPKQ